MIGPLSFLAATVVLTQEEPLIAKVSIDAGQVLRRLDPQRLGGTNVAMWYLPATYDSPDVQKWMRSLQSRYIRMPGGSWSNAVYWNGNGVRLADGSVDTSKVGPDGYPAVDYSGYAPSFLVDPKTLHPASGGWHGHVDVKKQHEFIKSIPGAEALACPNAGTGRPVDAEEWVKWANKKMGYGVRYWEIGNELGGSWEAGTEMPLGKGPLTAKIYTKRYTEMADAMRQIDPNIKIGSCPYVEETLRDCGRNVDFVSIHSYPGSTTLSDSRMFADIGPMVQKDVGQVKDWIHRYQPDREKRIEIAYSEWNLAGGINSSRLFTGLWSSIFLGEIAKNGVSIATQWDCFSDLLAGPEDGYARKPEYYALSLWNNYMGDRLISAASNNKTVYTTATESDDAVSIMLVNTDQEREAKADIQLSNFPSASAGEMATVSSREYYYDLVSRRLRWSTGPGFQRLNTRGSFEVNLPPFSVSYIRVPKDTKPTMSGMAKQALQSAPKLLGEPELSFDVPSEVFVGDQVRGALVAQTAGSHFPYAGPMTPATLQLNTHSNFDRHTVRLSESVGYFTMTATAPGDLILSAQSGKWKATKRVRVKPSVPKPVVLWDFSNPPVGDKESFSSSFTLTEDLTQRANRAVARVTMAQDGSQPSDKNRELLKVIKLPPEGKLDRQNIRGVVFDLATSADFRCEDPNASVTVIMQSSANWWMNLGSVPLSASKNWQTYQFVTTDPNLLKALPAAFNIIFVLQSSKPVTGSVSFDKIGLMIR